MGRVKSRIKVQQYPRGLSKLKVTAQWGALQRSAANSHHQATGLHKSSCPTVLRITPLLILWQAVTGRHMRALRPRTTMGARIPGRAPTQAGRAPFTFLAVID